MLAIKLQAFLHFLTAERVNALHVDRLCLVFYRTIKIADLRISTVAPLVPTLITPNIINIVPPRRRLIFICSMGRRSALFRRGTQGNNSGKGARRGYNE